MSNISIPVVEGEDSKTKNIRMLFVSSVIVIISLIFLFRNNTEIEIPDGFEFNETIDCNFKNKSEPVMARYIVVYNITQIQIPLDKIVVVQFNGVLLPLQRSRAKVTKNSGISIEFDIGKEVLIRELILDINKTEDSDLIMATTQVEFQNSAKKVVWYNFEPLAAGERYLYLYMKKPKVIHHEPIEVLPGGHAQKSQEDQEDLVNNILARNTWK